MAAPLIDMWKKPDGTPGPVPTSVVPLGRIGSAQELGGTVLYLASPAGAYTNGTLILVDGAIVSSRPSVL